MVIGVGSGAMAQDRTPVQDAKLLLIAAIDAPSGQAQGVLVGEIADAITQRFKGTTPIYIDVTTERRYAQAGCSRLKVRFWQDGVQLPGRAGTAPSDHRLRHQLLPRRATAQVVVVRSR